MRPAAPTGDYWFKLAELSELGEKGRKLKITQTGAQVDERRAVHAAVLSKVHICCAAHAAMHCKSACMGWHVCVLHLALQCHLSEKCCLPELAHVVELRWSLGCARCYSGNL